MSDHTPIERVLAALRDAGSNPRGSRNQWTCRCPAHDDTDPSLSIGVGDDGRALLHCHARCPPEAILAALGLDWKAVMPDDRASGVRRTPVHAPAKEGLQVTGQHDAGGPDFRTAREAVAALEAKHGERTAAWTYKDAAGTPVGLVIRWDRESKIIRPVSKVGECWRIGGMPTPRPLYRLPELLGADPSAPVYVAEGEKTAEALVACGLLATTSPHGADAARHADWSILAGRDVIILPDHDGAGERYAEAVAACVRDAGAKSVRIVRLADRWPDLPTGADAVDVLERIGGDPDAFTEAIHSLTEDAGEAVIAYNDATAPLLLYRPFPVGALPASLRVYVTEASGSIGCDAAFVALPLLSGIASAIGLSRHLRIKRDWFEPSVLWSVVVGESGTAKTPAMKLALEPVRDRQARASTDHATAHAQWQNDQARYEADLAAWKRKAKRSDAPDPPVAPPEPVCPRTFTDDSTVEALIARLQDNPRGLLMIRDELSGWFNFDRYVGGRGGGDVARWLEFWSAGSIVVDRKTGGSQFVARAAVSIAGGIQPGVLRRAMTAQHRESGLAARMLFAWPPRTSLRFTEIDIGERTHSTLKTVFDRLYALQPTHDENGLPAPASVGLTADGKRALVAFFNEQADSQLEREGDEAAAWSKLRAYAARLALVLHLVRWAEGDPSVESPNAVDAESVHAAVGLVRWFANETERVYAMLAGEDDDQQRYSVIEWIRIRGGRVTPSDLSSGLRRFRGKRDAAEQALNDLVDQGFGRWKHTRPSTKGGQPSKRFVLYGASNTNAREKAG